MMITRQNRNIDCEKVLLLLILGLGFCLRIYQLGKDPFWIDELGVAMAAFQSSVGETIAYAQNHIMAMPLDYVIAWFVARFSHDEAFLRLPEALWGTATLLAGYLLFTELTKRKEVAIFATFLLAVSPILIKYSQELRFYAPLVFFYVFATWMGIQALKKSTLGMWVAFTITMVIGLYFHFYILFVLLNIGFLYLALLRTQQFEKKQYYFLISSTVVIILFFLIGLLNFGSVYGDPVPLQLYETFSAFLLTGLGWLPPFRGEPTTYAWGIFCAIFALLGIFISLKKSFTSKPSVLIYSIVIQIFAIIFFDIKRNYFLSARQLLMIVPLMLFYTAYGVGWLIRWAIKSRTNANKLFERLLWVFATTLFVISVTPTVFDYYRIRKSSVHEIVPLLTDTWQPEEKIAIVPYYNYPLFVYYSQDISGLSEAFQPLDIDQISEEAFKSNDIKFIILDYPLEDWMESILLDAEFSKIYIPSKEFLNAQSVWQKYESN